MSDLIDTTEMYLRTIYELYEEGIPAMRARITERLHQSGPTVSQTIARMERDGLLTLDNERRIKLTDYGWALASAVMRKHRLVELLLDQVIGLEWHQLHGEACRWEHVVSEQVEARLMEIVDDPNFSPYGNPTPGLDALRNGSPVGPHHPGEIFSRGCQPIPQFLETHRGPVTVEVKRISEHLQADSRLLTSLAEVGLRPGATVVISANGDEYSLKFVEGRGCVVDDVVANSLFVAEPAKAAQSNSEPGA